MDSNLELLGILLGVGSVAGCIGALFMSESVRRLGLLGVLRSRLSGGSERNPYRG
jgi:hypothetical protein